MTEGYPIESQQRCRQRYKKYRPVLGLGLELGLWLAIAAITLPRSSFAAEQPMPAYKLLTDKANTISTDDRETGWAYILSGAVTLTVSIPAYYLSTDLFARVIYTVGETLGVAAIGYGSYLVLIDNDYTRYKRIIDRVPNLTAPQKDNLARIFLDENAERARRVRRIRVITHSLTAALNFLSAATSSQSELRTSLYFIGGVNTLAALGFGLKKSEEEKLIDGIAPTASLALITAATDAGVATPALGLGLNFRF